LYQDIATARSKRESAKFEETDECSTPGFVAPAGRARCQTVRATAAMVSSSDAATMRAAASKATWATDTCIDLTRHKISDRWRERGWQT
jgi:hypothetical protein